MSLPRLLLAVLLLAAPVTPWLMASASPAMKCCPIGKEAACCSESSCSIRRCAPPEPLAFVVLLPCLVPARRVEIEPAVAGRVSQSPRLAPLSLASELPDPPPRA